MPPKSLFWRFFEKVDNAYARCKLCSKKIKTSGNTSNLKCHLTSMHKQIRSQKTAKELEITFANSTTSSTSSFNRENESSTSLASTVTIARSPPPSASFCSTDMEEDLDCDQPSTSTSVNFSPTQRYLSKRQKTIGESFDELASCKEGGTKNIKITNAITYMICHDYQPLSVIENEGFRHLLKVTTPNYTIPSRKTITKLLENKYDVISQLFKSKIASLDHYSVTTDIWTETFQSRSFLGLTIHFLENSAITSATLGVFELNERHTAAYLEEKLNNIFAEWEIKNEKVTAVISDGARNITKSVETIFGKRRHLHCFAHQLNLVVERALLHHDDVKLLIKKVKDIVTWFKKSNNASDELRKHQEQNNPKKLIQEVPTRWNSTYHMIVRFLELREVVNQIINRHPTAPVMVTAREILDLIEIQNLLQPFEAATNEIGGQAYTTTSLVIPMAFNLHNKILNTNPQHEIGKLLKAGLTTECEKRFFPAEKVYLLQIATLLDPRFKKMYFRNALYCTEATEAVQNLIMQEAENDMANNINANIANEPVQIPGGKYCIRK
jgi:hypothetical protein